MIKLCCIYVSVNAKAVSKSSRCRKPPSWAMKIRSMPAAATWWCRSTCTTSMPGAHAEDRGAGSYHRPHQARQHRTGRCAGRCTEIAQDPVHHRRRRRRARDPRDNMPFANPGRGEYGTLLHRLHAPPVGFSRVDLTPRFAFNEIDSYSLANDKFIKKITINWGKENKWEKLLNRVYTLNE